MDFKLAEALRVLRDMTRELKDLEHPTAADIAGYYTQLFPLIDLHTDDEAALPLIQNIRGNAEVLVATAKEQEVTWPGAIVGLYLHVLALIEAGIQGTVPLDQIPGMIAASLTGLCIAIENHSTQEDE